jgi:serpin B
LWATPFEKKATRKGPFYLSERKQKSVPFMSQTLETAYLQGEGFQSTGLSYGDGKVSMYIFLPSEDSSLKEFLGNLNADNWDRWMSEFRKTQVELMLPRFKAAYDCSLRGPLGNLSGKIIFTSGADFSPMGLGNHFVSRFKHRALVEVNEEGTEAAATTAVLVGRSLFGPPRFIVNRPFFLAIRDNKSQTILFTGIIVDPD